VALALLLPALAGALGLPAPVAATGCGSSGGYTPLWQIQGSGTASSLDGQRVARTRGVVTADQQTGSGGPRPLQGFFLQADEPDCDAATSDGVFVYTGSSPKAIATGSLVQLNNPLVSEYQGPSSFVWDDTLTELDCRSGCTVSLLQPSAPLPAPAEYDPPGLPAMAAAYAEPLEGMRVAVRVNGTAVAPLDDFQDFVMVRGDDRDRVHIDDLSPGRIMVEGGGIDAAACGVAGLPAVRTLDRIAYDPPAGRGVIGPLSYGFNAYKVEQDGASACVAVLPGDLRSYDPAANPAPTADATTLTVAAFNVENLFDAFDDPIKEDDVATADAFQHRLGKLAAAICDPAGLNRPLILGLEEVESIVVAELLAGQVALRCRALYQALSFGDPDDRSIQLALLVRVDRVTPLLALPRQACSARDWGVTYEAGDGPPDVICQGATPFYLHNRAPLELTALVQAGTAPAVVHVLVNHFKSKLASTRCASPDCADWRLAEAAHVRAWAQGWLALDPNARIAVVGDFNDDLHSPTIDALVAPQGPLVNLWSDLPGPPSTGQGTIQRYSYIFNGVSEELDHILVSPALADAPHLLSPRHLDADWPAALADDPGMFRASDHDPVVAAFRFA
jgi:hypothetical protein